MYKEGYRRRVFAAFVLSTALALPMTANAMSLTLADAIRMALAANTGLRVAQTGERSADAVVKQARGRNSIAAEASDTLRTSKTKDEDAQTSNSLSVSARLPLYSGGANEANIAAGELGARAARLTTERAREDLKYEVTAAYWDAVEASKKIEVQRDTVNKYDAHLKNVTALYEAGAQAKIDVLRSSVELSNARQELVRAENTYAVSLATLRNLLNIDRTEELTLTTEVAYQPFDTSVDNCISYAHRSRLDLIAARAKLRQRELSVESARAGKKPTVSLTLGTGLTSQFEPRHDTSADVSASVGVSWNIFDSGVTRGAIEAAEAERDIALLTLKKAEETLAKARDHAGTTGLFAVREGVVSKIHVKKGDLIDSGASILTLDLVENCWIEAEISAEDMNRIYPGQIVRYELSGLPAEATVEEITDSDTEPEDKKIVHISVPHDRITGNEENITLHFLP